MKLWTKTKEKLPFCRYTNGFMNWSDPIEYKSRILGQCKGTYFKESGGFFRDDKTAFDLITKHVSHWRYIKESQEPEVMTHFPWYPSPDQKSSR